MMESYMNENICIGANEVQVIERKTNLAFNTYLICKVLRPTFSRSPFMTICESDNQGTPYYHSGHYDMSLMDACKDFYKRLGWSSNGME
jgi:hypothetical protein